MLQCKHFIDIYVPITTCNLTCEYCYVAQQNLFKAEYNALKYSANFIRQALSKERLGGVCCFNFCGGGETLLLKNIVEIIEQLLLEGHYVMIVTNGTVTKRFEEFSKLAPELLNHLMFKFSYHYLQLKNKNLLDIFFKNVELVKNVGCSYSLELPAYDDFIPYIDEIQQVTVEKFGAYPHVTVLRDDRIDGRPILSKLSFKEYKKVWESFNSDLFNLRLKYWGKKQRKFCYAGYYTALLNLENGSFRRCNSTCETQNIYENINKPIDFSPIGYKCPEKHCYISHAWLTFGNIPELEIPTFDKMRNRKTIDGKYWLTEDFKNFLNVKLKDTNGEYSFLKKIFYRGYH